MGEDVIVAPVLQKGKTSRNIYLPEGKWIDQNDGSTHQGPIWLTDYDAPLDVLPYFVRSGSVMHMSWNGTILLLFGLVGVLIAAHKTFVPKTMTEKRRQLKNRGSRNMFRNENFTCNK